VLGKSNEPRLNLPTAPHPFGIGQEVAVAAIEHLAEVCRVVSITSVWNFITDLMHTDFEGRLVHGQDSKARKNLLNKLHCLLRPLLIPRGLFLFDQSPFKRDDHVIAFDWACKESNFSSMGCDQCVQTASCGLPIDVAVLAGDGAIPVIEPLSERISTSANVPNAILDGINIQPFALDLWPICDAKSAVFQIPVLVPKSLVELVASFLK